MPQVVEKTNDIRKFLSLDGESIEVDSSITVGRQLDNDLVVAGEDVLDFHIRIEPTERGLKVIPLGEASLTLNGADYSDPVGLVVGDRIQVGQNDIGFTVTPLFESEADEWRLCADLDATTHKLTGCVGVGRGDDNEIVLLDDHVSRRHATLQLDQGIIWLRDLGSANGTFVNGERISGGCRLFHGDELSFDALRFQLIGKGQDLTPVRPQDTLEEGALMQDQPTSSIDTTEIMAVDESMEVPVTLPETSQTGAFLLGVSPPVSGVVFRTAIGQNTIGRDDDCDIVLQDPTVSNRHAEIIARAEGCTVTNLMATNGTRINGQQVQNAQLNDGDRLRIGQVTLIFRDVPPGVTKRGGLTKPQWIFVGASIVFAAALVFAAGLLEMLL